jgi:hypothetical protein
VTASLSATETYVQHVEACPDIGPVCSTGSVQPYQHALHLYVFDAIADAELGLVPHLSVEALLDFRMVVERIAYLDLAGNPYFPPFPDTHHRNETLVGPADPWLMLHGGLDWLGISWTARVGITLPLGSTVPNPFILGDEGLPHEHIQFGDGTVDPLVGLTALRSFGTFSLDAWTLERLPFYANGYGYQAGAQFSFGAGGQSSFGTTKWLFGASLEGFHAASETWSGLKYPEGNVERTDFLVDLTVGYLVSRWTQVTLDVRVPVYTHAVGSVITYPAILTLSVGFGT